MLFKFIKFIFWFSLFVIGLSGGALAALYYNSLESLPNVDELKDVTFEIPMQVYSKDNKLLAEFGEHKRIPIEFDKIPERLKQAFLAIEDSRFYEHSGIDPIGIIRAVVVAVSNQKATQGASTITQQVARNFFLTREKSIERKIKEIFISWRIEQVLTKEEIFELYLNKIALGHRAYGVVAAAQVYYGKTLDELTLGQMATIAGLPKAPSTLNPISRPERSKARRHLVLSRMLELGYITQEEFEKADAEPYKTYYHSSKIEAYAPYVAEEARQFVIDSLGESAYTDGIKVYTTVDSRQQDFANYAVFKGITDYDNRHGYRGSQLNITENKEYNTVDSINELLYKHDIYHYVKPAIVTKINDELKEVTLYYHNYGSLKMLFRNMQWARKFISDSRQGPALKVPSDALKVGDLVYTYVNQKAEICLTQLPDVEAALVAINPDSGAVEAMVGGFDFNKSKLNRATQAVRQSGSTFKPFLYSAALAKGIAINSVLEDAPIKTWDPGSRKWWSPKNTPNRFDGPMTLREGLAKSKNVISVRLMRQVGVDNFVEHLKKFGIIVPKNQQSESMSLGTVELTPLQAVTGFAVFANGGYLLQPYLIDRIEKKGEIIYQAAPKKADRDADDIIENDLRLVYKAGKTQDPNLAPQVLSHGHAFIISDMLRSVVYGGRGINGPFYGTSGRAHRYTNRLDLYGKTGTTNDIRDAWFIGYNRNLVAGAWIGFDNSRNLGYSVTKGPEGGAYSALPIFSTYFKEAQSGVKNSPIPRPKGVGMITSSGISDFALSNSVPILEDVSREKLEIENTGIDTSEIDESDIFN